jgi:hypothetical protein
VIEKRCPTCGSQAERLNDPSRLPVSNVRAMAVNELHVVEWHNKPEPVGRPDCVAFVLELHGFDVPLVVRLKSAAAVNDVIGALERHRDGCWPGAPRR